MRLLSELRRRNVDRMAVLYVVAAWLIMQVAEVFISLRVLPHAIGPVTFTVLAIGFPIALIFSWFYELTPEGISLEKDTQAADSITHITGRRMDFIVISLLSAAVILFAYDKWWVGPPPEKSIAVLAFENMSGNPDHEYFSDGISEEILNVLSHIPDLHVISRASAFSFKGKDIAAPKVAQQLNVAHVLDGSVRRAGDRVRITVQLVDAQSDENLWSESYDREFNADSFFEIQEDVARQVVRALTIKILPQNDDYLAVKPTQNSIALDEYLKGRHYLGQPKTIESLTAAVSSFTASIAQDTSFAEAYAGLCEAHLAWYTMTREQSRYELAEESCLSAMQIDSNLGEVHAALGSLQRYAGRFDEARTHLEIALDLNPSSSAVFEELGRTLRAAGESIQAEKMFLAAIHVDPENWSVHKSMGNFLFRTGRYSETLPYYQRVIKLIPDEAGAYNNLGAAYMMLNDFESAIQTWDNIIDDDPSALLLVNYANVLDRLGNHDGAVKKIDQALELTPDDYRLWLDRADYLEASGKIDAANESLRQAIVLCNKVLKVQPNSTEALSRLAYLYAQIDESSLAESMLKRLSELNIVDPNDAYFEAAALLELGRLEEVPGAIERAISLGYPRPLFESQFEPFMDHTSEE